MGKRYKLVYRTSFAAAHRIDNHEDKCSKLHGHTYKVEVEVMGKLDNLNMVIDVAILEKAIEKVLTILDHSYVNEVLNKKNVTMELIADWIMDNIARHLPPEISVTRVVVCESDNSCGIVEVTE